MYDNAGTTYIPVTQSAQKYDRVLDTPLHASTMFAVRSIISFGTTLFRSQTALRAVSPHRGVLYMHPLCHDAKCAKS